MTTIFIIVLTMQIIVELRSSQLLYVYVIYIVWLSYTSFGVFDNISDAIILIYFGTYSFQEFQVIEFIIFTELKTVLWQNTFFTGFVFESNFGNSYCRNYFIRISM